MSEDAHVIEEGGFPAKAFVFQVTDVNDVDRIAAKAFKASKTMEINKKQAE